MTQDLALKLALYKNLALKLTSYRFMKRYISERGKVFINSLNFEPYTISRNVIGEKFDFYIGNPTGKSWYGSTFEDKEIEFVRKELINSGAIVIECGAHHGFLTILLSRWVGDDGKVIAVEPMSNNVAILRKNIELNGLRNVTVVAKAAGPTCGYVSMKRRSNGAVSPTSRGITNQVECVTGDVISQELNIVPSLLKIDVEGFEYKVLEGCKTILSNNPAILLEIHPALVRYGNKFDDLWNFINPDVYDIFVQTGFEEPVPYSPGKFYGNQMHLFFKPRPTAASLGGWRPDKSN